jgi:hypothetical protein
MRIWPFNTARAAATPAPAPKDVYETPAGRSGTVNVDGYLVDDDYNRDLQGRDGLLVFQKMLRGDAAVRESYLHCVAPILNANADIDPAGDDPDQLEQAAFARCALFDWMCGPDSFSALLPSVLKFLPQGFQLFEVVERVIDAELEWVDPKTNKKTAVAERQFITWKRWAHRKPETIWRWFQKEGALTSVQQMLPYSEGRNEDDLNPTIQAEHLALFTNEREGDDFTGQSIFRSAYFAWSLKSMIEKIAGLSMERHGLGILTGYIPESEKGDEVLVARVEDMLRDISAGERPYIVFSGPKQGSGPSGAEGFLLEIVTPQSGGLPEFVPLLSYLRGEIKGAVVARFSELGHSTAGARATGDVQSQVWYDALHAVANYVASVFNEQIRILVDKNYAGVKKHPRLIFRDIETRSLNDYATSLSKLALANLIIPDRSARGAARKAADIPDEDEETVYQEPGEPQPPQPIQQQFGNGHAAVPPSTQKPKPTQPIESE